MTPAMRQEAIADITSWVGTTMAIGYGLYQAGAQISLNPDDSDFLQARFGNKVYDVSGGTANYVRTYLRLTNAVYDKFNPKTTKYESNKSTEFGAMSAVKFLNNKLAPNTRYVSDLFFNKDFAPSDIVAMYPMYAPEVIKSFQEDGVVSFATVLAPNLLGVGYGNYHTRDEIDTDLDELKKRNMRSDELNKATIKNYNDGGREITDTEFQKFITTRDKKIEKEIEDLYKRGAIAIRDNEPIQVDYLKLTPEEVVKETTAIKAKATKETKKELFGEPSEREKEQKQIQRDKINEKKRIFEEEAETEN